jgi:hypothetical protein
MGTLRQQLAAWAVDEHYPHAAELTNILHRIESYNQYLPGVHTQMCDSRVRGKFSFLSGSLWYNGGEIVCYFDNNDDVFEEPDTITIPNSVLDNYDWEFEIKRLTNDRHEEKLARDIGYHRNCISGYELALIQQKQCLAEAEEKLLALRANPA